MSLAYHEKYTLKDYRQWQGNWELVYGEPIAMTPSPLFIHQFINLKIARQLDEQLDNCPNCHAVFETDVEFSNETVVRPDTMVICYEPDEKLTQAPELVFEVISPSTAKRDELLKFDLYQSAAVKYYCLVYPEVKKATLYELIENKYQKLGEFSDECFDFELSECNIYFDFGFIWKK